MKDERSRIAPEFKEITNRIKRERFIKGKDKKLLSNRRITLAMSRHKFMRDIEQDIIRADLK